jgi:fatty acid-binding protein DegV
MPASFFAEKDIPFICYHFEMEGREYPDDLGKSISFKEFFDRIDAGAMPVTSQINVEEFMKFFEPFLSAGLDIVHIGCLPAIGHVQLRPDRQGRALRINIPNAASILVDTLGASSGFGLLVDTAWEKKSCRACLPRRCSLAGGKQTEPPPLVFFSTDLRHYKRGGRISATSAALGTLLNICPS